MSNPIFHKTPVFILLNKKNLFESMILSGVSLRQCFPDYTGPDEQVQPAIQFVVQKFRKILHEHNPGKSLKIFVIAAKVRMDMKIAFNEIKDTLKKLYPVKGKLISAESSVHYYHGVLPGMGRFAASSGGGGGSVRSVVRNNKVEPDPGSSRGSGRLARKRRYLAASSRYSAPVFHFVN